MVRANGQIFWYAYFLIILSGLSDLSLYLPFVPLSAHPKDGKNRNERNHDSSERVLPSRGDYQTLLSF